jgi:hypothetical protein
MFQAYAEIRPPGFTRSLACECKLRFGRIDPLCLARRTSLDQQFGECAAAATDIDPAQTGRRREPVKEDVAGEPAPASHALFVSSPIVEADLRLCHRLSTPLSWH